MIGSAKLLLRGHSGASRLGGTPRFLKAAEDVLLIKWIAADASFFVPCLPRATLLNFLKGLERALDSQSIIISGAHILRGKDATGIILQWAVQGGNIVELKPRGLGRSLLCILLLRTA